MSFARLPAAARPEWIKKKVSGEQFDLMTVTGTGDLFLADAANDVILLYLNNEALQVESLQPAGLFPQPHLGYRYDQGSRRQ